MGLYKIRMGAAKLTVPKATREYYLEFHTKQILFRRNKTRDTVLI